MIPKDYIKKYPRLAAVLLSIAEETDVLWAAKILEAARTRQHKFAQSLIREAWHSRHQHLNKESLRAIEEIIGEELTLSHLPTHGSRVA